MLFQDLKVSKYVQHFNSISETDNCIMAHVYASHSWELSHSFIPFGRSISQDTSTSSLGLKPPWAISSGAKTRSVWTPELTEEAKSLMFIRYTCPLKHTLRVKEFLKAKFSKSLLWGDNENGSQPIAKLLSLLEKTLESPLNSKEIKPVNPKGSQSWIFIGRTDVEAEAPILWLPDTKSWLIGKDPDAGKDWGQEVKQLTEDEMVGWHHWLNRHGYEQTLGDSEGLVYASRTLYSVSLALNDWILVLSWFHDLIINILNLFSCPLHLELVPFIQPIILPRCWLFSGEI